MYRYKTVIAISAVLIITFISVSCMPASTPMPEIIQQPVANIQNIKVGLDPGHGWGDSQTGAVGNGLIEKDINLEIALITRQILENNGIEVVMTREGDSYDKKLYQAAEIMNNESPVLVVSIHTNSSGGSRASGTEACYTVGTDTDEQSKILAQLLTESIANTLSVDNRGIYPENSESICGRGRGGLYIHYMKAPSAIIETGFLSNPIEAEFLKNRKSEYAQAIAQAIMNYLRIQMPTILSVGPIQPSPFSIAVTIEAATIVPTDVIDQNKSIRGSKGSSTAMLFDVSGSMEELDLTGITKLDAAKDSGSRILDIIQAENSVSQGAEIAILSFSDAAWVNSSLTLDVAIARSALYDLYPMGGTGMPDGLRLAIDQFTNSQNTEPIIIMLSDGIPNIGLGGVDLGDESLVRRQVLDLASEAGTKGICIYAVGFGIPGTAGSLSGEASIDEDFLKQVAANSGCGAYYNAQNATELANVYVNLRHQSTGNILLSQTGNISQGQTVDIGNVQIPDDQSMILFTLNWPGSQLDAILMDPAGLTVDSNYPNASLSSTDTLVSIIVQNPQTGEWKLAAKGVDVPESTTNYNAVISARPNPNPPTAIPQETPQATIPTTPAFPIVILFLILAGGSVAIYVMVQTRSRRRSLSSGVVASNARLVAISGERSGQAIMLVDRLIAGRSVRCRVRLNEKTVSRQHAIFRFSGGNWYVQDMNSQAGTIVNGYPVKARILKDGDRIQVGSSIFEFRYGR